LLATVIAVIGFVFNTRTWILYLNDLTPVEGLIVYYVILYATLYVLSRMGLVVFGLKIDDPVETFGLLMITFAFFITVDWSSPYVQYVTTGSFQGTSNVFVNNSEDGMTWYLWSLLIPQVPANLLILRLLTFIVTPFILTVLGGLLVSGKIRIIGS
jgi:hypothetical protein